MNFFGYSIDLMKKNFGQILTNILVHLSPNIVCKTELKYNKNQIVKAIYLILFNLFVHSKTQFIADGPGMIRFDPVANCWTLVLDGAYKYRGKPLFLGKSPCELSTKRPGWTWYDLVGSC